MKPIRHLRWYILALIFLATIVNYLDRMTINVSAPVIAKLYGLNNETLALVFSAFLWAYTFGPWPMGWVMDRLGSRRGYALSMGLWSGAGVLTAFAMYIGKGIGAGFGGIAVTWIAGYLSTKTHSFKSTIMLMGLMPVVGIAFLYLVIGRIAPYRRKAVEG